MLNKLIDNPEGYDLSNMRSGDIVAVRGTLEMLPGGSSTTMGVRIASPNGQRELVKLKDVDVLDHKAFLSNGDTVSHSTFTRGETGVIQMLVNELGLPSGIPTKALVSTNDGGRLLPLSELNRVTKR